MDVLPTAVLSLSMGIYFWYKLTKNRWFVALILFISIASRFLFFRNLPSHTAINVSYAISGVFIGLPLVLILIKTAWSNFSLVAVTIALFTLALVFRETDTYPIPLLPMGTHFLWHVFSGAGAYFILSYLYSYRRNEIMIKAD
jgi:hemolysin III